MNLLPEFFNLFNSTLDHIMKTPMHLFPYKAALPAILATGIFAGTMNAAPPAKPTLDPSSHAAHVAAGTMPPDAPKGDPTISELQAKVAQLEASLAKAAPAGAMPPAGPMAVMAMPPAGPMAGMGTPPAGPMAGMASPGMGAGNRGQLEPQRDGRT